MANELTIYQSVIDDVKGIIASGMESAYNATSRAMVLTYWNVGRRIVEQEQKGNQRAEYGAAMMDVLASEVTKEYGKSYSKRNLQYFRKFYQCFPDIEIVNSCVHNLTWTHFRSLLRVADEDARVWYMNEAAHENWNVRMLDRNISTQYYYRLLQSPKKEAVITEMRQKNAQLPKKQFELVKSPVVAEFLGFKNEDSYLESDLESAILSHIRDFLMEMGRGFAFVARQQHIVAETEDCFQQRSKKELIEAFISTVNVDTRVTTDWRRFVLEQEENDLAEIISGEKLKDEETRKFVSNAFRDSTLKTTGMEIDKLMPLVSRFGGGSRAKKKQGIIAKLKVFFEKYFGLGITEIQAED